MTAARAGDGYSPSGDGFAEGRSVSPEGPGHPGLRDKSFVHLHVHTEYSMLDGAARLRDLFTACQTAGMPAVAITDHGNVYGAYDFWAKAGMPAVWQAVNRSLSRAAPSSMEYSVCTWRCTKPAPLLLAPAIENRLLQACAKTPLRAREQGRGKWPVLLPASRTGPA